jgi:hypothetical protein
MGFMDGITQSPAGLYGYEDSSASPTPNFPLYLFSFWLVFITFEEIRYKNSPVPRKFR